VPHSRLAISILVAVLVAGAGVVAAIPDEVPVPATLDERARELERLRGSIARLQGRLESVRQRVASASDRLAALEVELELQEQRVAEAVAAGALATERAAALEAGVAELERRLEAMRASLRERVVALHRLGRTAYLRMLLTVETKENLLPAIRQLRFFARRDRAVIDAWIDTKARLDLERRDLDLERARVAEWLESETERRDRLGQLRTEQARMVAAARREELNLAQQSDELIDKARKLGSFLDFLYGRSAVPLAGEQMQSFKGVLDWPIQGRIAVPFGPRRDPRYGTLTPHNGLEIATEPGVEVRAVYPGRVVFAAPFQGYGPTVIMAHAGRVFTLYAGLGELEVREGDVVSLGAAVGRSAEALYFEIRDRNEPVDPRQWLR
jgi:septal ring factor EnvC (AmiA/AmiB activator)